MQKKKLLITYGVEVEMALDELMRMTNTPYKTILVRMAILDYHHRLSQKYNAIPHQSRIKKTPGEKVIELEQEKKAKLQYAIDRGTKLCTLLDGKITSNANGSQICSYTTYQKYQDIVSTGTLGVSLTELSETHVDMQYRGGTQNEIEKILNAKKLKTKSIKQEAEEAYIKSKSKSK